MIPKPKYKIGNVVVHHDTQMTVIYAHYESNYSAWYYILDCLGAHNKVHEKSIQYKL